MDHKIKVVCGDWSNDGHGMTDSITIKSNLTKDQLESAYANGSNILGFDFKETVGKELEDNKMSQAEMDLLHKHNIDVVVDEYYGKKGYYSLDTESYTEIILGICKLGYPNFMHHKIETEEFHIGGYGLFYG